VRVPPLSFVCGSALCPPLLPSTPCFSSGFNIGFSLTTPHIPHPALRTPQTQHRALRTPQLTHPTHWTYKGIKSWDVRHLRVHRRPQPASGHHFRCRQVLLLSLLLFFIFLANSQEKYPLWPSKVTWYAKFPPGY
jgi:hypothetical protein